MKKSLKLIPAIVMLLVSAILVSTTTFAWFSMNTQVTATGMQVTAKSQTTFLLIRETSGVSGATDADKAASIQAISPASTSVLLTVLDGDADVYPCKPYNSSTDSGYTTVASTATNVSNYATAAAYDNWFTANSLDPATSTTSTANDRVLTAFTDYVITKSVTLTLAEGAEDAHNLTVTGTILPKGLTKVAAAGTAASGKTYYSYADGVYTNINAVESVTPVTTDMYVLNAASGAATIDITAVKVLVVTDDNNIVTLSYATNDAPQSLHTVDTTLTDDSIVVVAIYIYYDGSEDAVTTNDKADLGWANISLAFGVEVGAGA